MVSPVCINSITNMAKFCSVLSIFTDVLCYINEEYPMAESLLKQGLLKEREYQMVESLLKQFSARPYEENPLEVPYQEPPSFSNHSVSQDSGT